MMLSQIYIQESLHVALTSGVIGSLSITSIIFILHLQNEIENIGHLKLIYVPALITAIDFLKHIWIKGTIVITKNTKWILFKSLLLIFLSICVFSILGILYGAPAFEQHEETLMFAIILTSCSTVHCLINMGFKDFNIMLSKHSNVIGFSSSQVVGLVSILGCWASSVVIPLDWDRWWQKWPIPNVMGTLIGHIVGHFIVMFLSLWNHEKQHAKVRKRSV